MLKKTRFSLIRDAAWERISKGIGDNLLEPDYLKEKRLQLDIQDWVITIDSYTSAGTLHTRFRAPLFNNERHSIKIFPKGKSINVMKFFGMQDIIVGHKELDDKYIIQGNNKKLLEGMFGSSSLRELLMEQDDILIQVKDDESWFKETIKEPVDELYVEVPYLIRNPEQLQAVFTIFAEILSYLCDNASAYFDAE
ncbi:MAG: hypothetical protein A2231_01975 [Candidatus Firestonebacteria bacterium RIFOXYA2_FULL_40_8]|nr:MAG: hypothetical protein A2231_01975 [Candidatus Firestonebacteria bacterium RIFOXYA2_FULL_40_8]